MSLPYIKWPGVDYGAPGLAGAYEEFEALARLTQNETGIVHTNLARDYWLTFCLKAIADRGGTKSLIFAGEGRRRAPLTPLAVVAFGGGTSLVSAWQISERYSEDLDVMALMLDPSASRSARKRPLTVISKWVTEALGVDKSDATTVHFGEAGHRQTSFSLDDHQNFLKLETSVEDDGDGIWERCKVMSLMGRFATPEQLESYPELGGFEMPVVTPAYTAANKFDALHRRADTGKFRGLVNRGRDLYDLAMIASSDHADAVSDAVPLLAERASDFLGPREIVRRPPDGYASSAIFYRGTEAQHALRDGYEAMSQMIWGRQPPFDEALELAASLDGG